MRFCLALLVGCAILLPAASASAHQPFFEEGDLTFATPMEVANPVISTAFYATLDRADDVDYFVFDGTAGTRVEIGMTIPQIEGQETFAPIMALIGPGLPAADRASLPDALVQAMAGIESGMSLLQPTAATAFYEPFSRTNYWRCQREQIVLPADGRYRLAVWSTESQTGRYVLVVGDREVLGGDPLFALKLSSYWTPVDDKAAPLLSTPAPTAKGPACHWLARLLARFPGQTQDC